MALPDFVIIGAMKCGTSTLAAQLGAQPGIFVSDPKEPNFFSDDDVYALGRDWYEGLFDAADAADIKGEASTHYTKLPIHPDSLPRMVQMLEAPKIIYLIRDPVARAVSHYIHEWTMGVMPGDVEAAFTQHRELTSYGCYAEQLAPYVAAYGRDHILVLSLESMRSNSQGVLEEVCDFLGYQGQPLWQEARSQVNASSERIRRFPLHGLIFGNPIAAKLRRMLVPQALRDRIKKSRQMQERPELPVSLTQALQAEFARDYRRLCEMFPDRKDLRASYPFLNDAE